MPEPKKNETGWKQVASGQLRPKQSSSSSWAIADKSKEETFYYSRSAVALRSVGRYK